jgi:hypothetical protein
MVYWFRSSRESTVGCHRNGAKGSSGGATSAPIARRIFEWLNKGGDEPRRMEPALGHLRTLESVELE